MIDAAMASPVDGSSASLQSRSLFIDHIPLNRIQLVQPSLIAAQVLKKHPLVIEPENLRQHGEREKTDQDQPSKVCILQSFHCFLSPTIPALLSKRSIASRFARSLGCTYRIVIAILV